MSVGSLKTRTIDALSWSFVDGVATRGVQFVVGIVLARLLFPEEFGLIGMLTVFIAVTRTFLDSGFGSALIQRREASQTDLSSVFYLNIGVGVIATGVLCLLAPWIAAFYDRPVLTAMTRALSLTIVVNSFGLIQKTLLTRQVAFKTQTKVSLIAGASSGTVGIAFALLGFGVWSLVAQQVSSAFLSSLCLWLFSTWRPTRTFSVEALTGLFGFGSRLLFSGVLSQMFDNIHVVVIGKLFSAAELGFFTRAKTMSEVPSQTLSGMVDRVMFPVFSIIQDDPERVKSGLKASLRAMCLVNFPVMVGLGLVARPLVHLLLTEKWTASIPYLQLLCVEGLLYPLHAINLSVLKALGRSDLFFRLEIVKKVLVVVSIALTWRWGIPAMICGMIAVSLVSYYLNSYYNGVLVGYPFRQQLLDLLPYFIASLAMGAAVYLVGLAPFTDHWSLFAAQLAVGIASYLCLCRAFRLSAYVDVWSAVRNTYR
ncbi:MAG TPA: lipopolysaccharide biosynthesis protein [Rhodothermia bacterium]|nr:lipopolysaccharide biosynthesis protein [Rhodothermia bacterium]